MLLVDIRAVNENEVLIILVPEREGNITDPGF